MAATPKGISGAMKGFFDRFFAGDDMHPDDQVFVETLFLLLGQLARADGIVTQDEANQGEAMIVELGLNRTGRKLAVSAFERGRQGGVDLHVELQRFLTAHPAHSPRAIELFDSLVDLAKADGRMRPQEKAWLNKVGAMLDVNPATLAAMLDMSQG